MNVTIRKIGNSEGIIIPKEVLEQLGLKAGDQMEVNVGNGELQLKAVDEDFARQVEHAEKFMERYKVSLQKLAK